MPVVLKLTLGMLFGIGFGYFIQRAGLCFAHGLGEIFIGRSKRILRMTLLIFIVGSIGFYLSGFVSPSLGLKPIGQLRGYGFYNLLSGMLFGAGILLNGGCILGTLRQLGEGNLLFLVVLISFIPGMALVVFFINPAIEHSYHIQKIILPSLLQVNAIWILLPMVVFAVCWYIYLSFKRG